MEKPQRCLEIRYARIARRDDRHTSPMLVLQSSDQQRTRFNGGACNVNAAFAVEKLSEERSLRDTRAKLLDERVVTVH
jgi:hypothetical protein